MNLPACLHGGVGRPWQHRLKLNSAGELGVMCAWHLHISCPHCYSDTHFLGPTRMSGNYHENKGMLIITKCFLIRVLDLGILPLAVCYQK